MKKTVILNVMLTLVSFLNPAYGQMAAWVNNQGCYCGGYPAPPVSFISRGDGTLAERTASQDQMAYWNRYAAIYNPTSISAGYGAPGNGLNEVNTFITVAAAESIYGFDFQPSTYGVAIILLAER